MIMNVSATTTATASAVPVRAATPNRPFVARGFVAAS
jgi:hypothetical protein